MDQQRTGRRPPHREPSPRRWAVRFVITVGLLLVATLGFFTGSILTLSGLVVGPVLGTPTVPVVQAFLHGLALLAVYLLVQVSRYDAEVSVDTMAWLSASAAVDSLLIWAGTMSLGAIVLAVRAGAA